MKRKSEVKLIIFDLDGTILDSIMYIISDFTHLFLSHGKKVPPISEMIAFCGPSLESSFAKYFPEEDPVLLRREYEEYYHEYGDRMLNVYPGEKECLRKLTEEGYLLAILSTKTREAVLHDSYAVGISDFFSYVIAGDDYDECKPSPKGAYLIMDHFHVKKEECFLIGDSGSDIQCGINAGIRTGIVRWGVKRVKDVIADEEYQSFADIERSFII